MSSLRIAQKRNNLATNSIALCFRMVIRMAISLYTTRVILNALGVEDYGIYNIIAGFTVMFSFVNTSMSTAISRFLAFELGRNGGEQDLIETFKTAFTTQTILAILIILLAEAIGIPIINHYLTIPPNKLYDANILYQCTLISLLINILQVPFNASIIAFEKMTTYAYIEIVYVTALLLIALMLKIMSGPLLIYYGAMLVGVNVLILACYYFYTRRFHICTPRFLMNWSKMKPMIIFSGADFYSNCSLSLQNQGQNIVINKFFGLVANASIGIASQVYGALLMFSSSITTAIRPRIIKSYAATEYGTFKALIFNGSRVLTFFNTIICIPLIFSVQWLLDVWLGEVPPYAVVFTQILLINHCLYSYKPILIAGLHATGKITKFSIISGTLYLFSIGIQLMMAYLGASIESVFGLIIILTGANIAIIIYYLIKNAHLIWTEILRNIVFPPTMVIVVLLSIGFITFKLSSNDDASLILAVCAIALLGMFLSSLFILDKRTRQYLVKYSVNLFGKLKLRK